MLIVFYIGYIVPRDQGPMSQQPQGTKEKMNDFDKYYTLLETGDLTT